MLVIYRNRYCVPYGQDETTRALINRLGDKSVPLEIPGAGALRITKAPLGSGVVGLGGRRGNLDFTSERGARGTLHLEDNTITFDRHGKESRVITPHDCLKMESFPQGPVIRATAMNCQAARRFVHRTNNFDQNGWCPLRALDYGPPPCHVAGFTCRVNGEPGGGTAPVWCQSGARRLEFSVPS
jgi:hypothetical protein